jgi:hypothetical protein
MSVKKLNGKGNNTWKIFLLLTLYYAVRTFLILELYVLRTALRHGRFFQENDPAVFIGYEAGL